MSESKDQREGGCCASSKNNLEIMQEIPLVSPGPNVVAVSVRLTFPPGDIGADPHTHSGPLVGYILEGELLFQMEGEPRRILKPGDCFYEKYGGIHVWSANASDTTTCRVIANVWGKPGEPILTFVDNYPRESRAEALKLAAEGK